MEIFFANCRLLIDADLSLWSDCEFLENFAAFMPYDHTFTLRGIIDQDISRRTATYTSLPILADTELYNLRALPDGKGWGFLMPGSEHRMECVLEASPDYRTMTLYTEWREFWGKRIQKMRKPILPFSSVIRCCCEVGLEFSGGIPMHASLVGMDGVGVMFLGPSGMGKSTQAKLWEEHLGADFISGDRPALRPLDGKWFAFGMPWDGKDSKRNQRYVPIKGIVVLEQSAENSIRRINPLEAKTVLFRQAIIPAWDNRALDSVMPLLARLSADVPFYHLACRPDREAVELTYKTLFCDNG